MEGPFNFETLSSQESQEKKSRALTKIEPSFFRYVANYLEGLEGTSRKEQEKNPSSKRGQFIADELRNATNKAEELWKAREKKIVGFAQVNARKDPVPPPPENLTRDESAFYHSLLTLLRDQWKRFVPTRAGGEPAAPPSATPPPARPIAAAPAPPAVAAPASESSGEEEAQTIRALADIPPFVGFDGKTYRIKKGDVVSLPKKFAKILKERNQAALVG